MTDACENITFARFAMRALTRMHSSRMHTACRLTPSPEDTPPSRCPSSPWMHHLSPLWMQGGQTMTCKNTSFAGGNDGGIGMQPIGPQSHSLSPCHSRGPVSGPLCCEWAIPRDFGASHLRTFCFVTTPLGTAGNDRRKQLSLYSFQPKFHLSRPNLDNLPQLT